MKTSTTSKKWFKTLGLSTITALLFTQTMFAQNIGINTTGATPNSSAILDLNTGNTFTSPNGKGLLIPKIALTGTDDVATVTGAVNGLLVYNTATAGAGATAVVPGFYYWKSTKWLALVTNASGWNTTGNAGTVDGTNFIGTTDDVPFNIKVNNQIAGRIESGGNVTSYGYLALASNTSAGVKNTAIGNSALASNTSGRDNTSVGYFSLLSNTTGSENVGVGTQSLMLNTTGGGNTAVGMFSLVTNMIGSGNTGIGQYSLFNSSGNGNTAVGSYSLLSNTTGSGNTGIGKNCLYNNSSGNSNTALGYNSLYFSTGSNNLAFGYEALYGNTTGNDNLAIGIYALGSNSTGNQNTYIGNYANCSAGFNNSSALGYNTAISASNQIRLGNASVTSIGGQVGWTTVSDKRFKINVKETVPGLAFITKLRPVTYNIDMDAMANYLHTPDSIRSKDAEALKAKMLQTGFIAQEVEQAAKDLGFDFSGVDAPKNNEDYYGLRYAEFTVPLVKAVQELNDKNNKLNDTNSKQQQIIEQLQKQMELLQKQVDMLKNK